MVRENRETVNRETPDSIAPTLWPANRPHLNPVDYLSAVSCRSLCTEAEFDVAQLKSRAIEEWEHFNQMIN